MAIYKISYYIPDSNHPGGILNLEDRPSRGSIIQIGDQQYKIQEVIELMPPQGDFHYLHVTGSVVQEEK